MNNEYELEKKSYPYRVVEVADSFFLQERKVQFIAAAGALGAAVTWENVKTFGSQEDAVKEAKRLTFAIPRCPVVVWP